MSSLRCGSGVAYDTRQIKKEFDVEEFDAELSKLILTLRRGWIRMIRTIVELPVKWLVR
jgi:hypothetical protein